MPNIVPNPTSSRLSRRWRFAKGMVRLAAWLLVAEFCLILLLWLCLHWAILPHIEQWRPLIETKLSDALGVPVRIGGIEARSTGWMPALEVRDVMLLDARSKPALWLPRVHAAVSMRSMLASLITLDLRLEQLLIEGAFLEIKRSADGRIFVAGLDFSAPDDSHDTTAADWFFKQYEFAIRDGSLRWSDGQSAAPPVAFSDVDLTVRNGLRRHDIRFDATPGAGWGERFELRGRFKQPLNARSGDWQRWSGQIYAALPHADVNLLREHFTLPFDLNRGEGALRVWLDVHKGRPDAITLDLALRAVVLRLANKLEPLVVEQVHGRIEGQLHKNGGRIELQQFGFLTGDALRWPEGNVVLTWVQAPDGSVKGGKFRADQLDLDLMAQTATRLPLGETARRLLSELQPHGMVNDLRVDWDGSIDAPMRYRADATLSHFALSAKPSDNERGVGRPGVRDAQIEVSATEEGGQATLAMTDGALVLPGVFDESVVPMEHLSAKVLWQIDRRADAAPLIEIRVKDAKLANADVQGELSATWRTGLGEGFGPDGRFPGNLQLDGILKNGVASRVARYLPLGVPEGVRRYVELAVRRGEFSTASFRVKGDLWNFPFREPEQGDFRIAVQAQNVALAYVPSWPASDTQPAYTSPWPALESVNGELVLERASLKIRDVQAQLYGVALSKVNGGIENLTKHSVLALEGRGDGPIAGMLRFVSETPVDVWTGKWLGKTVATGSAELQLGFKLPLHDLGRSTVSGTLRLAGNDVRIGPDVPLLSAVGGRVNFSHEGVSVSRGYARAVGSLATFRGGSQPDGTLRFNVQGKATAEGLRSAPELGLLSRLASNLSGQTNYRLNYGFVRGLSEISVISDLVGLAVDLPMPLTKSAESAVRMHYNTTLDPGLKSSNPTKTRLPWRDTLRFELGDVVRMHYQRDLSGELPRVLRGGVGVNETAPVPADGVAANITVQKLNADAWKAVMTELLGPDNLAAPQDRAAATNAAWAGGYGPSSVALRAAEVSVGTRKLTRVVAGLSQVNGLWRANLDADHLNGYLEYRPTWGGVTPSESAPGPRPGHIYARLARLNLPKSEVEEVESLLDQQASNVPGLDIVVDEFELRGKKLGRVEVEAVNQSMPISEWRLTRFLMSTPEAKLTATGRWAVPAAKDSLLTASSRQRSTQLDFRLELADSGALLKRLGSGEVIRGGKGLLQGDVTWVGSPLSIDYPSLSGQMNLAVETGQFLKVEPGAARLLGVLSLQALPRRLALDFRDVFQEGFAFDSISGDVKISTGVATTNNLRMRGVQAAALMDGSADLAQETQDLRVVVVPEINAGTASLVYTAINPAVGLGTFLAQLFLRQPLIQAGTREFHVSGSWTDPKVDRIERKPGQPVPKLGPAGVAEPVSASQAASSASVN